MADGLSETREKELMASKTALFDHFHIGRTKMTVSRENIRTVRAQFPEYETPGATPWEKKGKDPQIPNWPSNDEPKLVGVALCQNVLSACGSGLDAYKRMDKEAPGQLAGAKALFEDMWYLDYWTFTQRIGMSEFDARKIAVEHRILPIYIWPSHASHLIYVANLKDAYLQYKGAGKCRAVAGYFTVTATNNADARVLHGEAFFLLEDGTIRPRKDWESKYIGFNQSQFMIHYVARNKLSNEEPYEGLICADRAPRQKTIIDNPKKTLRRAYVGKIHVLGSGEKEWDGSLYAEEVDEQDEDSLKVLFSAHHKKLCSRIDIID